MITYTESLEGVTPDRLAGFFVGWTAVPSSAQHLETLRRSTHVVLAVADDRVVGFVNALSDGVLSGYLPLLEVLPSFQGQGIGSELVRRVLAAMSDIYAVDTVCDADLRPFYERQGMVALTGMAWRNPHAVVS